MPCIREEPWEKAKAFVCCTQPCHQILLLTRTIALMNHTKKNREEEDQRPQKQSVWPCFPLAFPSSSQGTEYVVGKRASQQQQQKNPLAAVVAAEAFFIASTFLYVNQSTMGISKTLHFIISIFVMSFEKGHRAPRDHWQETNFAKPLCGSCHFQSNCCRRAKLPSAHKAK